MPNTMSPVSAHEFTVNTAEETLDDRLKQAIEEIASQVPTGAHVVADKMVINVVMRGRRPVGPQPNDYSMGAIEDWAVICRRYNEYA